MDELVTNFFKQSLAFTSLDEEARNQLSSKFTRVDLKATEILFNQGDPSECVYLLIKGRLSATLAAAVLAP